MQSHLGRSGTSQKIHMIFRDLEIYKTVKDLEQRVSGFASQQISWLRRLRSHFSSLYLSFLN